MGNQITSNHEFNGPGSYATQILMKSTANWKRNWGSALNNANESNADLKIICSDGTALYAHQLVVALRNPVFAGMLTAEMVEKKTGVLNVDDVSSKTMKIVLHFLYTADLLDGWDAKDTVVGVVYAAGKFQLTEVLKYLDAVVGAEGSDYGDETRQLMDYVSKFGLRQAEARLLEQVKKLVDNTNTTEQLFLTSSEELGRNEGPRQPKRMKRDR